jgi:hypothetical protein
VSATDCTGVEIETLMEIRTAKAGQMFQEVPSQERRRISVASNVRAVWAPTAALPAMLAEVMNTTGEGREDLLVSVSIVIRGRATRTGCSVNPVSEP